MQCAKKKYELMANVQTLRAQGEQLVSLIDNQKVEVERFDHQINDAKKNQIQSIKAEWDVLSTDMKKLEKDLIDKQSTVKNVDKQIRDSEAVQKKLSRFVEDLQRNLDKNKKRREEAIANVRKLKREYELKRERQKEYSKNLKDIDAGKEVEIEACSGLNEQMAELRKNIEVSSTELKMSKVLILRLEAERNECQESLKQLHVQNEQIRQ